MLKNLILLTFIIGLCGCSSFETQNEVRHVKNFNALKASGLADVIVIQSEIEKVELKVSGMPLSSVKTFVDANTLYIDTVGIHSGESVKVFVYYRDLNRIETANSAAVTGGGLLETSSLELITNDSGDIDHLALKADKLIVQINGSGNADLLVDVQNLTIEMNDSGDLSIEGKAKEQRLISNASRGTLDNSGLTY